MRAIFLDRDGVLNKAEVRNGKPYPPASASDLEILPDVLGSLTDLKRAGYLLLVATNQPDVGNGIQTREAVEAIHARLMNELPLDDIFVCYHADSDKCSCRKPTPGLLEQAVNRYGLSLAFCYMVGDRWRDVDAGHGAGCQTILIDYGYSERSPMKEPAARVTSLREAADWILRQVNDASSATSPSETPAE